MTYSKPFVLLSLSTVMALASAASGYAQTNSSTATRKTSSAPAKTTAKSTNQVPESGPQPGNRAKVSPPEVLPQPLIAKTILPSRAKQTIRLDWLQRSDKKSPTIATQIESKTAVAQENSDSASAVEAQPSAPSASKNSATTSNQSAQSVGKSSNQTIAQRESEAESAKTALPPASAEPSKTEPSDSVPATPDNTLVETSPALAIPSKPTLAQPETPLPPITPDASGSIVPTTPASPTIPAAANQAQPGKSATQAAVLLRKVPVPEYLSPAPNPLTLPTKPSEVTITGAQPITLEQAIELAERNNRTIEQAKLQLEQSRAALREAQATSLRLSFQGDATRSKSADTELNVRQQREDIASDNQARSLLAQQREDLLDDSDDATTRLNASFNLNYDLFTAGRRTNQIRAAERLLRISELEVDRVTSLTRFNVSDEYYQLQDAEEQITISKAAVRSSQSNLRDTRAQFEAGLGTKFDVLRVQVQLANNQQQLTTAIANREIQRRRLAQRLSLPETVIVIPADKPLKAGDWPLSLEQTIVLAYKNRAELEQQLAQREVSEARRKIALSALGPTVSLIAQANFLEVLEDSVGIGSGYSVGARIQWQLFDGGVARAQATQQAKNKQLAESRFAEQREAIRFEVEQAYATLIANGRSIATTEKAIEQAQEALRLAVLRFQAGVGTQTERIDAESDLTRARGNNTSAVIGYNRSLAQLRRAVSNLPTDISKINRVTAK